MSRDIISHGKPDMIQRLGIPNYQMIIVPQSAPGSTRGPGPRAGLTLSAAVIQFRYVQYIYTPPLLSSPSGLTDHRILASFC